MTESEIIRLLAKYCRERKLQFFAHVKDGGMYARQQRILDGFAISAQFVKDVTVGYEIKISRSDFLRDNKWQEYLPVCQRFYFVCPWDLIQPNELPDGIGLLYATDTGLMIIKKAKRREVDRDKLFDVLKYLVFHRGLSEREKIAAAIRAMNKANRGCAQAEKDCRSAQRYNKELQLENIYMRRRLRELGVDSDLLGGGKD